MIDESVVDAALEALRENCRSGVAVVAANRSRLSGWFGVPPEEVDAVLAALVARGDLVPGVRETLNRPVFMLTVPAEWSALTVRTYELLLEVADESGTVETPYSELGAVLGGDPGHVYTSLAELRDHGFVGLLRARGVWYAEILRRYTYHQRGSRADRRRNRRSHAV